MWQAINFFSEHPDLFLTGNLAINYAAVPVWLLPLQLQMSSVENVSYYLYTCAIYIKNVLMDWNHQLPKLLYIVCCTTFLMDHSILEARGQRKKYQAKENYLQIIWKFTEGWEYNGSRTVNERQQMCIVAEVSKLDTSWIWLAGCYVHMASSGGEHNNQPIRFKI